MRQRPYMEQRSSGVHTGNGRRNVDLKQVRLDALNDVMNAIVSLDADLPRELDPSMLGTDTRRLALEDALEAIQRLYGEAS